MSALHLDFQVQPFFLLWSSLFRLTFIFPPFLKKYFFFHPGLPFQIEQDGEELIGTFLCPVRGKMVAKGRQGG